MLRKVTLHVANLAVGKKSVLEIGNLDSARDFGYAPDYVEAMYLSLQHKKPETFVFASGKAHSVREVIEMSFSCIDKKIRWEGKGLDEKGFDLKTGDLLVEVSKDLYRKAENVPLVGDSSRAARILDWKPKVSVEDMVKRIVEHDIQLLSTT